MNLNTDVNEKQLTHNQCFLSNGIKEKSATYGMSGVVILYLEIYLFYIEIFMV